MKNLFSLLAFSAGIFMATAQTKEETINWLQEKLKAYGQDAGRATNVTLQSVDECKIVVNYTLNSKDKQGKINPIKFQEILPTDIDRIVRSNESFPGHFVYREEAAVTNLENGTFVKNSRTSTLRLNEESVSIPDVEKAIKHLATFCRKK
ncbi:hypothetical protein D1632_10420 [Chryseobacterium nematophagum]|uniref:DUF4468 domain-containing protein n=1 Tax=Chryseobacterium nematophagum TaxID=2305228 RepID=A0A3M7LDC8_9FLAO|nr:hypothetical protein [Chryseobacterium nematophagum]RMZ60000.1 hypothetical protein D1632_10420 [Chryseobacterium nematophagum]